MRGRAALGAGSRRVRLSGAVDAHQQAFVALRRGRPAPLPPPVEGFEASLSPQERLELQHVLSAAVVGSPDAVRQGLTRFLERTDADELIVVTQAYDHTARLRSYELTAGVLAGLSRGTPQPASR